MARAIIVSHFQPLSAASFFSPPVSTSSFISVRDTALPLVPWATGEQQQHQWLPERLAQALSIWSLREIVVLDHPIRRLGESFCLACFTVEEGQSRNS